MAPFVSGLAAAMLSSPVAGAGGVCSREWIASISPCSGARPCRSAAGLAALDLTARGPRNFGRELVGGQEPLLYPLPSGSAGLVGLLEDLLSGSTPSGGAVETAGRLDTHLFRLFASPAGRLMGLAVEEDASRRSRG